MDKEYFASINEVSREMGLPAHTLRYWEKQFPTVVRPIAGAGGRRYYRPETIARLKTIQDLLYNRGMTIAGVKKLIHNGDFSTVDMVASTPDVATQDNVREKISVPVASSFDATKVDLAIGLLTQARELLK
ncbi:MAG: MerR family transcriptional regulator [Alphaproteobacteria bacterium]|nr:MerR family transcriptional regulator [Alphaproteobacteria bacterium]